MDTNNRKRSRKSKLVLRQVVELDEELQKVLDISQDILKPEESYLDANNASVEVEIAAEVDDESATAVPETKPVIKTLTKKRVKRKKKAKQVFVKPEKVLKLEENESNVKYEELLEKTLKLTKLEEKFYEIELEQQTTKPTEEKEKEEQFVKPVKLPKFLQQRPDSDDEMNEIGSHHETVDLDGDHTYSKQQSRSNTPEKSREFSVNIEVEEFDDEHIDTDSLNIDENCDYGYRTNSEISVRKDLFLSPSEEASEINLPKHLVNNIILGEDTYESLGSSSPAKSQSNNGSLNDESEKVDENNEKNDSSVDEEQHNTDKNNECTESNESVSPATRKTQVNKKKSIEYVEKCAIVENSTEFAEDVFQVLNQDVNTNLSSLRVFIRNTIGSCVQYEHKRDPVDQLIYTALETWTVWFRITRHLPMYYKCYVCNLAWWHLNDLREHLHKLKHNVNVDIEVNDVLCNIVAYDKSLPKPPNMREMYIPGKCWICCRGFKEHRTTSCTGCNFKFTTCALFIKHTTICDKYTSDNRPVLTCPLCLLNYHSQSEYDEHFILKHTVRSDQPVPIQSARRCLDCNKHFKPFFLHDCPMRVVVKKICTWCNTKFSNHQSLKNHLKNSDESVTCPECGFIMEKKCIEPYHMLKHTDAYSLVIRCILCEGVALFKNDTRFRKHKEKVHPDLKLKTKIYFGQQMIFPTKVLEKYEANVSYFLNDELISRTIDRGDNQVLFVKPKIIIKTEDNNDTQPPTKPDKTTQATAMILQDTSKDTSSAYEQLLSTIFGTLRGGLEDESGPGEDLDLVKVKTEIKEEPFDYDMFPGSVGMSFLNAEAAAQCQPSAEALEPEIVMGEVVLKRTYCCRDCGYIGYHEEFREHTTSKVCKKQKLKANIESKNIIYRCTKCCEEFLTFKGYIKHLVIHGFKKLACPECLLAFQTPGKLIHHLQQHIKELYQRLVFLTDDQMKQNFCYQCKTCKLRITEHDFFEHWETHLEFKLKNEVRYGAYDADGAAVGSDVAVENEAAGENDAAAVENDEPVSTPLVNTTMIISPTKMKEVICKLRINRGYKFSKADLKCILCSKVSNRKTDVKRHLIEHLLMEAYANKPKNGGLKCQICQENFNRPDDYKLHMRDHASLPIYRCELCNKSFSDSSNFAKHKKVHNLRVRICDHCGKKFHKRDTLEAHMLIHKLNVVYPCDICGQQFEDVTKRRRHIRRAHDHIPPKYWCLICRTAFKSVKEKWDHQWEVHNERQAKADCPICGRKFRKLQDVRRHASLAHRLSTVRVRDPHGDDYDVHVTVD